MLDLVFDLSHIYLLELFFNRVKTYRLRLSSLSTFLVSGIFTTIVICSLSRFFFLPFYFFNLLLMDFRNMFQKHQTEG